MKQIIKDVFVILEPLEKRKLWLLAVADVLISILDITFLIALLFVINFYSRPAQGVTTLPFFQPVFNAHPLLLITVFFLLFAAKNAAGFSVAAMQYRFVYGVASRISRLNLRQYLEGDYNQYVHVDSSVISRRTSQQPIEFCHYVLNGLQQVFSQAVLVLITIIAVLIFNPLLFPLLLLILTPPVFLVNYLVKRKLEAASLHGKKSGEKSMQHLQEALYGYVESNIYNKNNFFIDRYYRMQAQLNHYLSERLIIQNLPQRLIEVFAVFGLLILVLVNYSIGHSNQVPLVTIGALMVAAYKIIPGIVKITNITGQVKSYSYAATDLASAAALPTAIRHPCKPLDRIAFENVCFNYTGKQVICSLSFVLERGDFMVVSDISGRGKTTLVNLLLGFLKQYSGDIYINGEQSDTNMRQCYWQHIAYARQQTFFLHASVAENITLQEHGFDKIKIEQIAASTGISTFIRSLPLGIDTVITENGKNFSGGQRQRISFARALYRDADLLILDEPFNELDELSELAMLHELKRMAAAGKMILLITHNKSALAFGNKKILLDESV